jgi:drug/metabolite transporter (DMT)-like permease
LIRHGRLDAVAQASMLRLVLLALMWGSSFLWIKIALGGLGPMQITVGRLTLGAAFLLTMCAVTRLRLPSDRTLWGHLLFVSLVGNAVPFALFSFGEQTVDSGLAGVLNATTPLWTAAVALLLRQERRPGPMRIVGLALGFAGTVLILAPWQGAGGSLRGALLCMSAATCYGVALVYSARFIVNRGIKPVAIAAAQISAAAGWALLATPLFELQPIHVDLTVTVAVVVLGLLGTGYAFVLVNRLLLDEGATSTSTVTYLLPVIAVLLGAVTLSEALNPRVLAGMVIVLAGVMLAQRKPRVAATVPETPRVLPRPILPPEESAACGRRG